MKTAATAINPAVGKAVDVALKTKKGDKYVEKFAEGETVHKGIKNVEREIKKETKRKQIILTISTFIVPLLLIIFLIALIFKNADTQIYSNENGGTVESEFYMYDDKEINIFENYPGLYENVESKVKKISDKYKV